MFGESRLEESTVRMRESDNGCAEIRRDEHVDFGGRDRSTLHPAFPEPEPPYAEPRQAFDQLWERRARVNQRA